MVCHWKQNSGGVGKGYREAEGGMVGGVLHGRRHWLCRGV